MQRFTVNKKKIELSYKELPLCFNYSGNSVTSITNVPNKYYYWYWTNSGKTYSETLPEGYTEEDFDGNNPCLYKENLGKYEYEQYSIQYPHIYVGVNGLTSLCYKYSVNNEEIIWHDMFTDEVINEGADECHNTEVIITSGTNKEYFVLTFGCDETISHSLKDNDIILFNREDGDVNFTIYKNVNVINHRRVYVTNNERVKLEPIGCYAEELLINPSSPIPYKTIRMVFEEHNLIENRKNFKIKENFSSIVDFYKQDAKKNREIGDYITLKERYLYQSSGVTENNEYILDEELKNTKNEVICYGGEENDEVSIKMYTPLNNGEKDSTTELLFVVYDESGETIYEDLVENLDGLSISCEDNRFFYLEDEEIKVKDGFKILKSEKVFTFGVNLEENGCNELFREQLYTEKLFEEIKEENINPIIDYEKQMFIPMINGKEASTIKFNLHFRERTATSEVDEFGNVSNDYGTWEVNDNNLWNNYNLSGNTLVKRDRCSHLDTEDADLLGYLGFTEEDVYYRKKRLKQSFLRLSFYDSRERTTQKLLYYSTIFVNTGEEYGKLIWLMNNKTDNVSGFTYDEGNGYKERRLSATFSATDKYNTDSSSEGFYLYLFPDQIDNESGETEIYMKVEFNNAKYGVTVPFIMPISGGTPLDPTSGYFPYNYVKEDGFDESGNTLYCLDMNSFHNDMYIEISIKKVDGKYVYTFPHTINNETNEIILNLFEPRLNWANKNEKPCK